MKTKVLIKIGMMCVELTAKKLCNVYRLLRMHNIMCILCGYRNSHAYSHVQNILQPHRQSTKLRNMIPSIMIKVLIKFGTSRMMCIELKAEKLYRLL